MRAIPLVGLLLVTTIMAGCSQSAKLDADNDALQKENQAMNQENNALQNAMIKANEQKYIDSNSRFTAKMP